MKNTIKALVLGCVVLGGVAAQEMAGVCRNGMCSIARIKKAAKRTTTRKSKAVSKATKTRTTTCKNGTCSRQ